MDDELGAWFRAYKTDVYNFLVYICGRVDVEDLVQETFIRAFKHLDKFSRSASPKSWLFAIARNAATDDTRKRQRQARSTTRLNDLTTHHEVQTPEEAFHLSEQHAHLMQAIQSVRPNYKEVLVLRGVLDLSVRETAEALGWTQTRVRVTYSRALKAVRQQWIVQTGGEMYEWA